jgi:hypothetical protein
MNIKRESSNPLDIIQPHEDLDDGDAEDVAGRPNW